MPEFLIWSEEHGGWWNPSGWGYTFSIRLAGRFTAEQATRIVSEANFTGFNEIAIPVPEGIPSVA